MIIEITSKYRGNRLKQWINLPNEIMEIHNVQDASDTETWSEEKF